MADHFDGDWAAGYDERVRCVIPAYEAMHDLVHVALRELVPEAAKLLVIGCGTGMEFRQMAASHPGWSFTGVDPSPDMMAICRRRLAEWALEPRVALHEGTLATLPDNGAPDHGVPAAFDAATLLLVLQFVPDDGAKLALLREAARRLKPGGNLILVDGLGERGTAAVDRWMEMWKTYAVQSGLERHYVENDLQIRRDALQLVSESRLRELFREAGFGEPERFFAAFHFNGWIVPRAAG